MIDQRVLRDEDLWGQHGYNLARAAWAVQRADGALSGDDQQGPSDDYVARWRAWYARERDSGRPPDLSELGVTDQAVVEPRYGNVPSIGPVEQPEPVPPDDRGWRYPPEEPIRSQPPSYQNEPATGGTPAPADQGSLWNQVPARDMDAEARGEFTPYDQFIQTLTDPERMAWHQTGQLPARYQAPTDVQPTTPPPDRPPVAEPPMPGRGGGSMPPEPLFEHGTPEPNPPQIAEPPSHFDELADHIDRVKNGTAGDEDEDEDDYQYTSE